MTEALRQAPPAARACVFTLDGAAFALPVESVREVVVFEETTPVPRAPAHVVGVANLRGEVMPVVDPAPRLGLGGRPRDRRLRTLVVAGPAPVALVIDDVLGLAGFDDVLAPGDAARRTYGALALGLLRLDGGLVTLLDASRLVGALRGEG